MFTFTVKKDEPLAPYTWFKIGGKAEYLVICETTEKLIQALSEARDHKSPYTVIGGGSNILISDQGLPGLTIINRTHNLLVTDGQIFADSGLPLNQLINQANRLGLAGLSGFLGVPGTVGGAIFNNSHYQNQLIGALVTKVDVWSNIDGLTHTLYQEDLEFGYDHSRFHHTHEVILSATLTLTKGETDDLITFSQEALKKRRHNQPLELPSSGCMFKNLSEAEVKRLNLPCASAGYLIDKLGMKGMSIGGAMISTLHANFIVNTGGAEANDVHQLVKVIKDRVWSNYHLDLETEVFFKGEFKE